MTPSSWTPADLIQLSGSYWATCALHAGVKLELFTPLATASHSAKSWLPCARPTSGVWQCCWTP